MPKHERIVVVDDDPGMNQAIERLLNAAGFSAITFPSAEALLENSAAVTAACFIFDIHLPGLSGFELSKRLAQCGVVTPIIFITAYDDPDSQTRAESAGAAGFFTKPFSAQRLVEAIKKALQPKQPSPL